MDLNQIKDHWVNWANQYSTDIRATTKTPTIKKLEVKALYEAMSKTHFWGQKNIQVMEVGCGNGHNCFALSELIKDFNFTGLDYVPEMIVYANEIKNTKASYESIKFEVGNILELDKDKTLLDSYHIIYTNRCIINLNNDELQLNALDQLASKVESGGYLIILENIAQSKKRQNELRRLVNLPDRESPSFNHFIDEDKFIKHAERISLSLMHTSDFGSLHDLILYVLVPMINEGKVDYDHPLVAAATDLSLAVTDEEKYSFGKVGQNRLYLFKKA